jgi:hypothetical protein
LVEAIQKKKRPTQITRSLIKKIFSPIGPAVLEKKGVKLFFVTQKPILRKTQKKIFYQLFLL